MNRLIELYSQDAIDKGLMAVSQFVILDDMFGHTKITLEEFVQFVLDQGIIEDREAAADLMLSVLHETQLEAVRAAERRSGVNVHELTIKDADREPGIDLGIEWFCCMAIEQCILTKALCWGLISNMDAECDLLRFAQGVINAHITEDLEKVQELTVKALERKSLGKPPPSSCFSALA